MENKHDLKPRWSRSARLGVAIGLPLLLAGVIWYVAEPRSGIGQSPPVEEVLRVSITTDEGIFLVLDAAENPDEPRELPAFVVYWHDFENERLYVFERLIYTSSDVGHALRNLVRDLGINPEPIRLADDAIALAFRKILSEPEYRESWVVATTEFVVDLMGYPPEDAPAIEMSVPGPVPSPDPVPEKCVPPTLFDGRGIRTVPDRPGPIASVEAVLTTTITVLSCGCPPVDNPCCSCPGHCCSDGSGNRFCCSDEQVCCGNECCEDPGDCCIGDCCEGKCCNDAYCCPGSEDQQCCHHDDVCCALDEECCGHGAPDCCASDEHCCVGECCRDDSPCCEGDCCPGQHDCICLHWDLTLEYCLDRMCCPLDKLQGCIAGCRDQDTVCWDEFCCEEGKVCCEGNCCEPNEECCGGECCTPEKCCGDACCEETEVCCISGVAGRDGPVCESSGCDLSVDSAEGCPGSTVTLTLTTSCDPECDWLNLELEKSVPWLDIHLPDEATCGPESQEHEFTVDILAGAPPGLYVFDIHGQTELGAEECSTIAFVTVCGDDPEVAPVCCDGECCPEGAKSCCNGLCCRGLCCGDECCAEEVETCCDDACCAPGQKSCCDGECCDGACCPTEPETCCAGSQYSSCCVSTGCCEGPCCEGAETCCAPTDVSCCGGMCCDGECCNGTTCCTGGRECCAGNCCDLAEQVCCHGECRTPHCAFAIEGETGCPGQTIELRLTGSCSPGCLNMGFETTKSILYLTVNPPASIPCTGETIERFFSVTIAEDAPNGDLTFGLTGHVGHVTCERTGTVTVEGMSAIPLRDPTSIEDSIYVLPNDVEPYSLMVSNPTWEPMCFTITDQNIAMFRVGDDSVSTVCFQTPPYDVTIHGLDAGETRLEARFSTTGALRCSMPILVGGSITLEFDQLPTYRVTINSTASSSPPDVPDFAIEHNGWTVPIETLTALENIPNAIMSYRIIVRDASGAPMMNKWVAVVDVPDDAFPEANRMTVSVNAPSFWHSNGLGRVQGTIQLRDGTLTAIELRQWKLLILVGYAAEQFHTNPQWNGDLNDIGLRNEIPIADRQNIGHFIRLERREFPLENSRFEVSMSVTMPHVGSHTYGIFMDFFEDYLGRASFPLTDGGFPNPAESWRLVDVHSGSSVNLKSDQWFAPPERNIFLDLVPRPIYFAQTLPHGNDVDELIRRLTSIPIIDYPLNPADPPVGQTGDVVSRLAWTLVTEMAIGSIPIFGDTRDIVNEIYGYAWEGNEISRISLTLSTIGLAGDLGYALPITAAAGVATNGVVAIIKAIEKALPRPIFKAILRILSGTEGIRAGLKKLTKYVLKFANGFISALDWVNPAKYYELLKSLLTQLFRVIDSPVVRHGGASYDEIADGVGATIKVLSDRSRALTDDAAEGIAGYIRHGDGGAEQFDELVERISKAVQDDSVESASVAFHKTYRSEFAPSPNQTPDPFGKRRVDEAVNAATDTFDPHLRHVVNQHIGPDRAIKSMEEFEALRFLRADNITSQQVQALNTIRRAMDAPANGTELVKVIDQDLARNMLRDGNPNMGGFFVTRTELGDVRTSQDAIDALRLDYPNSTFAADRPHVIIETQMTSRMKDRTAIPRSEGYANGDPLEVRYNGEYPYTGNGMIASRDGRLRPEWRLREATEMTPDTSVMRFRNPDGTPLRVTLGSSSASDWRLVPDATSPTGFTWSPQ